MTNEELDHLAKEAFPEQDLSFEDKYWADMEAMLDKRGKKRGFIFWWGAGIALLGLFGFVTGQFMWNPESSELEAQYEPRTYMPVEHAPLAENAEQSASEALNETSNTTSNSGMESTAMDQAPAETKTEEPIKQQNQSTLKQSETSHPDEPNDPLAQTEKESPAEEDPETAQAILLASASQNATAVSRQAEPVKATPVRGELPSLISEGGMNTSLNRMDEKTRFMAQLKPAPFALALNDEVEIIPELKMNDEPMITEFGEEVPESKKKTWFVEVGGAYHQYASNETQLKETQDMLLTASPEPIKSWDFGANTGIRKGNWSFYTGLHYAQMQQNFSLQLRTTDSLVNRIIEQRDIETIDSTFLGHRIIKVPNGSGFSFEYAGSDYDYDTTTTTVEDTTYQFSKTEVLASQRIRYKLQYLKIPLGVGYMHALNDKFLLEGFASVQVGFLISSSGDAYHSDLGEIHSIDEINQPSSLTFDYQLGLGVGYFLSPDWSIRLRPNYQQTLVGPFGEANYNRNGFGANAVMRFEF